MARRQQQQQQHNASPIDDRTVDRHCNQCTSLQRHFLRVQTSLSRSLSAAYSQLGLRHPCASAVLGCRCQASAQPREVSSNAPTPPWTQLYLRHRPAPYLCSRPDSLSPSVLYKPSRCHLPKYQRHPYCPRNRANIRSLRQPACDHNLLPCDNPTP
jgi:hypothetical protein